MIPTIGILIAGYVFLRCLEILATIERIQSRAYRVAIAIVGICMLFISVYSAIVLLATGSSISQELPGLR